MIDLGLIMMVFLAAAEPRACLAVSGGTISAGDLARVNPLFSSLDPGLQFGFAPLPGSRRLLLGRELAAFLRNHAAAPPSEPIADVCIERSTTVLSAEQITAALASTIATPDARIEVLAYSTQPLPPGRLEFLRSGLSTPVAGNPDAPLLWRGRLIYDEHHSLAIWAKVRVWVERPVLIAARDLKPGHAIEPNQVKVVSQRQTAFPVGLLDTPEQALGKIVTRPVREGYAIPASAVKEPDDVGHGDKVQVRVVNGSAYVSFEGVAVSGGHKGDRISLRNPSSGRTFRGIIDGKGSVVVKAGGPA